MRKSQTSRIFAANGLSWKAFLRRWAPFPHPHQRAPLKVIFDDHRRSSATSGRSVPLPLPPSVGQRGRPRVAGGERNTTPRRRYKRRGVLVDWTRSEWVSGKRKVRAGEGEGGKERRARELIRALVLIQFKWRCRDDCLREETMTTWSARRPCDAVASSRRSV